MSELEDYVMPEGYGDTVGKCLTFGEIEALLAAERERCAKVAEDPKAWADLVAWRRMPDAIATAIRNLPPQTEGG